MLIGLDEHPLHQIAQSFAGVAGSDSQWNDGHYVCLCDADGNVCLTSNVRLYQNNDVLDGFVCIRHEGRQHNIRLSRRLRPDMDHYGVGPLRIEIVEPMRTLRFVLDENEFDISCDVLCTSTVLPYEDPVEITRVDGRLLSERATYELVGVCDGWVEVAGKRYELTASTSSFFRNHSWGNQAGRGGPRYGAPRPPAARAWRAAVGAVPRSTATAASTSSTRADGRPPARGRSCSPTDPSPSPTSSTTCSSTTAVAGCGVARTG